MKRTGKLWNTFCSTENLLEAMRCAQRGKRFKETVSNFNFHQERELLALQNELVTGRYRCGGYRSFSIYEPKHRFISAAPYRDRVIHQAVCRIIEPIFERGFIFDLYSNRKGKGAHRAVTRYQNFCRHNTHVLKCDISKYFASVDKQALFGLVCHKIKDHKLLRVIKMIIGSFVTDPKQALKGMPLGNLTSQLFANVYLDPLDHFIKETLRCRYYIRYVDDFVVFDNSKARLAEIKRHIEGFIKDFKLTLHPRKSQIRKVSEGVLFLGYRIFPTHRLIDKNNIKRFHKRVKKMQTAYAAGSVSVRDLLQSLGSWNAHASHADSYRLRTAIYDRYTFAKG